MTRKEYTAAVLGGLRHVTESEKEQIRAELDAHMEDHMLALVEYGYERGEAERRAASSMGDPAEVSRELQKCYAYGWLIASRILGVLLAILCVVAVTELLTVGRSVHHNLQARFNPMSYLSKEEWANVQQELDIEIECGNSVVKFFAVGENGNGEPRIIYTIYNKNPLGYAAKNIDIKYYLPGDMETDIRLGGGYFRDAYVCYGQESVWVQAGTDRIIAVVSWWDEEELIEIPIGWEVGA